MLLVRSYPHSVAPSCAHRPTGTPYAGLSRGFMIVDVLCASCRAACVAYEHAILSLNRSVSPHVASYPCRRYHPACSATGPSSVRPSGSKLVAAYRFCDQFVLGLLARGRISAADDAQKLVAEIVAARKNRTAEKEVRQ